MREAMGKALHLFNSKTLTNKAIFMYCLPLFFWFLADSIMSYIFPIIVEDHVNSNTLMGIIMALSSIAGLISDFIFPQLLKEKSWKFQLLASVLLTFLFPVTLTLGAQFVLIHLFILGSIIWGIYWELMNFSEQNYVVDEDKDGEFSKDWGILYLVYQVTTIIGPILGSLLISTTLGYINFTIVSIQAICLLFTLFIIFIVPNKLPTKKNRTTIKATLNIFKEVRYWKILSQTVWPAMLVSITVTSVNAVFWTIGGLFGQTLFGNGLDWLVLVIFSVPTLVGSLVLTRILVKSGKKRYSQVFLLIGSLFLTLLYFAKGSSTLILFLIVMSSFSLSFVAPLNEAVFSDLLDRLKKDRLHLLGVAKANTSIAYIIGPLFAGFLADKIDYLNTFTIAGIGGVIVGMVLIIFTPRKLKLRQKAIEEINLS